jgi:hypothetical protein
MLMMLVPNQAVAGMHSRRTTGRAAAVAAAGRALAAGAAGIAASFFTAAAPGAPTPMMTPQTVETAASAAGDQGKNAHPCKHQSLHLIFLFGVAGAPSLGRWLFKVDRPQNRKNPTNRHDPTVCTNRPSAVGAGITGIYRARGGALNCACGKT